MPQLLVVLAAAVSAAPAAPGLDQAVTEYDRAQQTGDGPALRRLLADDYLLVNSGGTTETKEQYIGDLTAPDFHMEPFQVLRPISRVWSHGALKGGVALLSGTSGGRSFSACLRFVDVWRREAGSWRVVYSQAAKAASADCRGPGK